MTRIASFRIALCASAVLAAAPAAAVAQGRAERSPSAAVETPASRDRVLPELNASATREELMTVLRRHPPSVGRVLKLDPSLMRNESYLASYPQLRQFLADHPDVPLNAAYYLQPVSDQQDGWAPPSPQQRMAENILGGLAGLLAFGIALGTVIWLIRTAVDHRRWNRLSKIQADVHTKLMDRFSSNDELLTYVQTPPARRFLESGPSPLQEASPAVGAPFSRILWSVQAGSVLLVSGLGLLFISARVVPEAREFFYIAGCLVTAVGAGFVVSAAAAFVLSRRLGLLDRAAQDHA